MYPAASIAVRAVEGTSASNGYANLFGGATLGSFADHLALLGSRGGSLSDAMCAAAVFGPGCVSTAAGAFQINKPTWTPMRRKPGLSDFSPASQDAGKKKLKRHADSGACYKM
ncbi:hypothetical protein ACQ4WN_17205 [Janthinobacterium sp. LB3P118]